ncbi:hypothetical protein H6802_00245 [Candidatus Nomurabacteria bacterium]|uniref:Uncharacterized protein n=1 Tax=candidate division WWE3 bacterium TaxID=2053526 RepID=A0A955IVW0_UNCKA|nr:hypothetical protein [candidate division WWE3 bacterium]MCB9823382.1 hypothetical protein [Candidatus Nomurabacteria bacterium]MCB9826725.1 hypothetical protein [Candidatus Nomurabacteria bacterium]MCB9827664.1 hypothetical protein [Candidatus Nomurabacteria bacterium]HXK52543.1 hypothetical protein [bacterium]
MAEKEDIIVPENEGPNKNLEAPLGANSESSAMSPSPDSEAHSLQGEGGVFPETSLPNERFDPLTSRQETASENSIPPITRDGFSNGSSGPVENRNNFSPNAEFSAKRPQYPETEPHEKAASNIEPGVDNNNFENAPENNVGVEDNKEVGAEETQSAPEFELSPEATEGKDELEGEQGNTLAEEEVHREPLLTSEDTYAGNFEQEPGPKEKNEVELGVYKEGFSIKKAFTIAGAVLLALLMTTAGFLSAKALIPYWQERSDSKKQQTSEMPVMSEEQNLGGENGDKDRKSLNETEPKRSVFSSLIGEEDVVIYEIDFSNMPENGLLCTNNKSFEYHEAGEYFYYVSSIGGNINSGPTRNILHVNDDYFIWEEFETLPATGSYVWKLTSEEYTAETQSQYSSVASIVDAEIAAIKDQENLCEDWVADENMFTPSQYVLINYKNPTPEDLDQLLLPKP